MESRKNPKADLTNKRGLFFNFGMIVALTLAISAFEWRSYGERALVNLGEALADNELLPDIPITKNDPPKPKKITQPKLIEIPSDEEIEEELDFTFDPDEIDIEENYVEAEPEPEPEPDVFLVVEQMPKPNGGFEAFYKFIGDNLNYPSQAHRLNIEGRVTVQFIVDETGNITDALVLKGIGAGCDEEALRVIKLAPKWSPGKQRGVPKKVRMAMSLNFRLN